MCASRGQPGSRLPRTSSDSTYCPGILGMIKFIGFISEWRPGPLLGAGELGLERKEKFTEAQSRREAYNKQAIRPSMGNTERREWDLCITVWPAMGRRREGHSGLHRSSGRGWAQQLSTSAIYVWRTAELCIG